MADGIWILAAAVIAFAVTGVAWEMAGTISAQDQFRTDDPGSGPQVASKEKRNADDGRFYVHHRHFCGRCGLPYTVLPGFWAKPQDMNMQTKLLGGFLMAVGFGGVGFIDDYIKVVKKRNLGLNEKQKLILQFLVAGAYLLSLYLSGGSSVTLIPFLGGVDLGIFIG